MAFSNPVVSGEQLNVTGIRSDDYVENVDGWRIGKDGSAQFTNLVIANAGVDGTISAPVGLFDDLTVTNSYTMPGLADVNSQGSTDLITALGDHDDRIHELEILKDYPNSLLAFGYSTSDTGPVTTNRIGALEMKFKVPVLPTPGNRLSVQFVFKADVWLSDNSKPVVVFPYIWFTDNGTRPNLAGTVKNMGGTGPIEISSRRGIELVTVNGLTQGTTYWCVAGVERYSGDATNGVVISGTQSRRMEFAAIFVSPNDVPNMAVLYNNPTPPPDPPDPAPTYKYFTYKYRPTWIASYQGDGDLRTDSPAVTTGDGYLFSGQAPGSVHGNQRALIGFDYNKIASDISGGDHGTATLNFKCQHTWDGSGATLQIGWHNYTSRPNNWSTGSVTEQQYTKEIKAGTKYSVPINNFASGAGGSGKRGIALGPHTSSAQHGYNYLIGKLTSTDRPELVITVRKRTN